VRPSFSLDADLAGHGEREETLLDRARPVSHRGPLRKVLPQPRTHDQLKVMMPVAVPASSINPCQSLWTLLQYPAPL
jgi:hypothetical protein